MTNPGLTTEISEARGEGAQIARLHALFEAISLAIAIFDNEQRLVSANAKFRELTGMDNRQALGRSIYDAFPNALADLTEQIDAAEVRERPVHRAASSSCLRSWRLGSLGGTGRLSHACRA